MDLRILAAAISALLVSFLVFPTIRKRIELRIASQRRSNAYPQRISSKEPFFNTDLIIRELRDRDAKQFLKRTNALFRKLKTKTLESYPFGHRTLETCDARNLQHILSTEQSKFGNANARKIFIPFIGIGIINTDGEAWVRSRKLITPTFTKTHIADREFFERHYERFLARMPKDGETVDLKPLFDQLSLDASSEFIFGESFDSQLGGEKPDAGRKFLDAFNDAQFVLGMRLVFGRLASLLLLDHRFKKFEQNCKMLREYAEEQVKRALNHQKSDAKEVKKEEPYILANELAKEIGNKAAIADQLLNVFLAGREAPAVSLSNVMFHLARNPTVWTKMREETKGLKPSDLSFETLKGLRYVQHAISEAMHLAHRKP